MEQSWGELLKELLYEMNPQSNYHGTGASLKKFDDKFIGTGQGAQVHGYGHYSADLFDTADGYRQPSVRLLKNGKEVEDYNGLLKSFVGRVQPHSGEADYLEHTENQLLKEYEDSLHRDKIAPTRSGVPTYTERTQRKLDALKELDSYKLVYSDGNVYKVNVPNEYFMLDASLPLDKQSLYVKEKISELAKDLPNKKFYINYPEGVYKNISWGDKGRDFYNDLSYLLGAQEKNEYGGWAIGLDDKHRHGDKRAAKMLNRYGIKGIRAVGNTDGPINVTFSGKNIKMANTPLQRIVNRIPTQTLGKIGNKVNKALQPVLTHPAVQTGGKVLDALDKYGRGLSTIMIPQSVMYQFDNGQGQVW